MSDNTRNFYGRSPGLVEERYMANVLGVFRAAVEEHLPLAVINDWNLNPADLAHFKVLILANTACLDDAQVAAVDQFVRSGGGLVASLDTFLFDEFGTPRAGFALGPVLGVEYRGLTIPETSNVREELDVNFTRSIGPDYWEKRKNVFDYHQETGSLLDQGRMRTYVGENNVVFKGPAVRVTVRDRAAKGPPIEIKAPICVHSTVMRQTKGNASRLIVHLFSDLNTTAFHALPAEDVPLREEVVPIHDIRVSFSPRYKLRQVHLEPDGKDLEVHRSSQGTSIVVPCLKVHSNDGLAALTDSSGRWSRRWDHTPSSRRKWTWPTESPATMV
jgi:hypothetical protein